MANRDEDSHDVLGTYKLVSNKVEMNTTPGKPEELLNILLYRHQVLMSARISKKPGQFKDKNNRAGDTHFVDHTLVRGTLIKGFDFYQALTDPFAKAVYMMFLIIEVHPFLDGNGRTARVMMNAELVKQGQSKIIIPTVYRDDYMLALRRLTRQQDPSPYIKMMQRAHQFSSTIIGDDMNVMEKHLEASNAFKEHDKAKLKIIQNQ
jgi:Fic family protein